MGRHAGYLAMYVGMAVGATAVLVPEQEIDFEQDVIEKIRHARLAGFTHFMVVVAEGAANGAYEVARKIHDGLGLDPRVTILGHIQRGGAPTARDRVTATRMGYYAVKALTEGKANRVVCVRSGDMIDIDIDEALAMTKTLYPLDAETLQAMTARQ